MHHGPDRGRAMRRALSVAVLLLCAGATIASAQGGAPGGGVASGDEARGDSAVAADSVSSRWTSRPVVVEAESLERRAAGSAQPLALISRAQIEAIDAVDLADVVALSPGAFVKQYGGLGGLRTLSLRGTSAQQTVVLIDGVRYQSSASGAVDLGLLPADAIERVEVIRGGDAALYGANALGGVINVVTRRAADAGLHAELRSAVGSFSERQLGLLMSGRGKGQVWSAQATAVSTLGDYPFDFTEFGSTATVRRENADFRNVHAGGSWSWRVDDHWRLAASAQGFTSERGAPGAVVQGNREELHARLDEREIFGTASAAYGAGGWSLLAGLSACGNALDYRDPDARTFGPDGIDTRYDRRELAATVRARRAIGALLVLDASAELASMRLSGDNLDPAVADGVDRTQIGGALLSSWRFAELPFGADATLDAGLRFDRVGGVGSAVGPSIGVLLHPGVEWLGLRGHFARNYRVPTFLEQYYLNYGNVDLRPERSTSVDAGVVWQPAEGMVIEAGGFLIDTRDAILSVPRSPVSWSAENVGRTLSRGVELSASGALFDGLVEARLSYTRMRAEDRTEGAATRGELLPYTPEELFTGLVELRIGRTRFGPSWEYASHRYSLAANTPEALLPRHAILGLGASSSWSLGPVDLVGRIEISNLLDARYQVIRNYPMPGRSARVGITLEYSTP